MAVRQILDARERAAGEDVPAVHLDPLRRQPRDAHRLEPLVAELDQRRALLAARRVAHARERRDAVGLEVADRRGGPPPAPLARTLREGDARPGRPPPPEGARAQPPPR